MRRYFQGFSFGRKKAAQRRIDEAVAHFEKWLSQQPDPVGAPRPEPMTAAPESTPKTQEASKPQNARAVLGPPRPEDFGVTPEQMVSYRPPAPTDLPPLRWTLLHLSACAIVILLSFGILPHSAEIPRWLQWLELPACPYIPA